MPINILVSACLLGLKTRYDGTDNYCQELFELLNKYSLNPIPVCPEQLAGLATPRPKCWFSEGDGNAVLEQKAAVVDENGRNLTVQFIAGARQTLNIAELTHCQIAVLQQRSPSCGTKKIYLGQELIPGMGVAAALLQQQGLAVFSDDHLPDEKDLKNLHR